LPITHRAVIYHSTREILTEGFNLLGYLSCSTISNISPSVIYGAVIYPTPWTK